LVSKETLQIFREVGIADNRIHFVQGTLDDEEVVKKLVNETVEKFGRIDVVICNAAVSCLYGDSDYFSTKCLRHVLEINLVSAINLVQLAVPHLTKTRGNVILVSAVLSYRTSFIGQFYGITKAALNQCK
jgi:NAD(P)-dependent dehydrogenase (short-subunit alcohol dehydrogenase family)